MGEENLNLSEFLRKLGDAQILLYDFERDPEKTMRRFGLPEEDIELVKSGDLEAIRNRVQEQSNTDVLFGLPVHIPPVHVPPVHWPWPWPPHHKED